MWFKRDKTPPTEEVKPKGTFGVCNPCLDKVHAGNEFVCLLCEIEDLKERVEALIQEKGDE